MFMHLGTKPVDKGYIIPWHAFSIAQTKEALDARPKTFGLNRLQENDAARWYVMLLRQFASLLVVILIVAALLSYVIGDKIDAIAIVLIIILNAVLGFVQEWKAETA